MNFETFNQLRETFQDEAACRNYLAVQRWGVDGVPCCPFCGVVGAYSIEGGKRYKCKDKGCHKKFSITVGTVFENTKLPLTVWFTAIYLATNTSKGVSSLNLASLTGVTQKTAWFVLCRVREMLKEGAPQMLDSPAQVDETYVGGKEGNKHLNKRSLEARGPGGKAAVFGILGAPTEKKVSRVVVRAVPDSKAATIQPIMRTHVKIGDSVHSDEHKGYQGLDKDYTHETVVHSTGEYVRYVKEVNEEGEPTKRKVHTNGIENFWSLFKRGVNGIYHQVSPKHLDRYCQEYAFRFNYRDNSARGKFDRAVFQADGRRLTYKALIAPKK